ncbi:MAG: hypothetical protein QXM31_00845 [Candidatus Woesearchaeota archaeon]
MDEKGIAMAILGIVAVIAVVGLVLLFKSATGMGLYGGELTRVPGVDLYEKGESVPRYTSPVPSDEGGTYYQYREDWAGLERDPCPYTDYYVSTTASAAGARSDCIPSAITYGMVCCRPGGRAYAEGYYD